MSKSNNFATLNAPKVIINSKILPCTLATKKSQLAISSVGKCGRLRQQRNELNGASSIPSAPLLRFFLQARHIIGKNPIKVISEVQQVQQRAVCVDSPPSAPSVGTHKLPRIQTESRPTCTRGSLALTVPDPNNALVSALFTVQQKFKIFTVGNTVIDIGCLPGTSSRCFRSWIDQDEDHGDSGVVLGNACLSGGDTNANKPSCTTESSRGDDSCRGSSNKQKSVAEIIDDAIEGRITEDETPHWRLFMLKRQKLLKEGQKKTKAEQTTKSLKRFDRQLGSKETKTEPKDFAAATKKPPSKGIIVGIDAFQRKPAELALNAKSFFVGDVLVNKTVQELGMDPHLLEYLSGKVLKLAVHRQHELSGDDGKADVVFVDLCPMLEKELSDAANQLAAAHNGLSDQCATGLSLSNDLESTIQQQLSPFHPLRHPQYYTRLSLSMLMENKIAREITNARRRMRKQQSLEFVAENDEGRLRLLGSGSATEHAEASFEVLSPKNNMRATIKTAPVPSAINSKTIQSSSVSSGESRFFDVSDNSTPFETFLDHVDAFCGDKGKPASATSLGRVRTAMSSSFNAMARKAHNKDALELATAKSILGDADAIVVKRGGGEVFVVRDDTSGFGQGSITGVSDRINFYDYPEILDEPNGSALSRFRPTPLSADSLFLTSLESTAAAVRMIKPYLKPFREIDLKEINASTCTYRYTAGTSHEVKTTHSSSLSAASPSTAGTSGKLLIRLVMPSEAQLTEGEGSTGNNTSNILQPSTNSLIRSSETRQIDHTVATSLGSISASYHAFIESLRTHFSHVEVVDKRHIREDQSNCSTSTLSVFTSYTQLLILAHNSNSPLIASELANAPRALKDNPAFILFDRELIIKSEESGGLNYINQNGQTSNGNRHTRAHELKHDLPAAGIVLPSGDGLGNRKDSYSASVTSSSYSPVPSSATHNRKKKFKGVFKHLSHTSRTSINFNPDNDRLKMRHTRWSPNRGFSGSPHSAPNANSIRSLRNALAPSASKAGSVGVKSIGISDRFNTLSSLSASALRPANLQVLTQNVIDASTTTFAASTSTKTNALAQNHNNRLLSLNTGSVVKSSASSVSGGGFSQRSVNGRRSRFFMSRYPNLLQAPPPAEELSLRMKKSVAEEIRREAAQERFNQFKMESIDNYHMHKVVGEDR